MAGKKEKRPSIIVMAIKTAVALFLILVILAGVLALSDEIRMNYEYSSKNIGKMINYCDRDYYNRDYGRIRETLTLYELYGEEFGKYWEVVNAYEDVVDYQGFARLDEYKEDADKCLAEIESKARECKYQDNQRILDGFLEMVKA